MKFKIVEIPEKGRGLVAIDNISKGELVESSPVLKLPIFTRSESLLAAQLDRYAYYWSSDKLALPLGYGSLFNHDSKPNLKYKNDLKNNTINYYAQKDILANEELTIDYGRTISKDELELAKKMD